MTLISGNQLLVETLTRFGVSTIFTLHGGHLDGVYRSALDAGIRLIDTRHEQAAGFAAQGWAKVTGDVGVAMATAGGGVTNLVTPVANAWADGVPMVFFGAAAPLRDFDALPVNSGYDQLSVMSGITKWSHRATVTALLPQVVARAFQIAREGKPGPVYIDLPTDVLFARVDSEDVVMPNGALRPSPPAPDPTAIAEVVRLLRDAKRPAVLTGAGSVFPDAAAELRELATRLNLPVLTNNKSKGIVSTTNRHAGGSYGALAGVARRTGRQADVVLILGARLGLNTGGRRGSVIPEGARVIQVDTVAEEIGRMRDIDLGITSAVLPFLRAVLDASAGVSFAAGGERAAWLAEFTPKLAAAAAGSPPTASNNNANALETPAGLARQVARLAPADTIFVLDGGETPAWLDAVVSLEEPRRWIGHGYMGIMGEGLPQAVGAQVASPDSPVICFTGDGALGFTLGEFDTLVRHKLPVIVIVNNDRGWAMSQHGQDLIYGKGRRMISDLAPSRYDLVAAAFGAHAEFVEEPSQFEGALQRALDSGGPACINVLTDAMDIAPVTRRFVGEIADGPHTPTGLARVPYAESLAV
ncbi:thiamine pyrophosphate-binding protein [Cryobacterium sp. SO1]|uniref:thiamine pyrophosphate-binding protein n=1 Tax=Cryobacterium sp. SO1 TaxID=1897061 RepID=UPI001022DCD2|nr:thiamine pyrophosphate-binding protein [Cryobacterium sp. SO1]RZI35241.1 Benzaldehyde lyase [Cryobacterium sp. SO1]